MIEEYTTHHCPRCGKEYSGEGKLGDTYLCKCGCRISSISADEVRRDNIFTTTMWFGTLIGLISGILTEIVMRNFNISWRYSWVIIVVSVLIALVVSRPIYKKCKTIDFYNCRISEELVVAEFLSFKPAIKRKIISFANKLVKYDQSDRVTLYYVIIKILLPFTYIMYLLYQGARLVQGRW